MESLTSYYLEECAKETVLKVSGVLFESIVDGDEIVSKDIDKDGLPDEFYLDLSNMIEEEIEFEIGENMKARAPKLKGKAEKARKNKANIMKSLMSNPEIQGLVARLKSVLKRTAKKSSSTLGVNGRAINKALNGKIRI